MSGPIVRKYGFPNFDKIFGERPLEHGTDDEKDAPADPDGASAPQAGGTAPAKKETGEPKKR
jgi:hypothetical protein